MFDGKVHEDIELIKQSLGVDETANFFKLIIKHKNNALDLDNKIYKRYLGLKYGIGEKRFENVIKYVLRKCENERANRAISKLDSKCYYAKSCKLCLIDLIHNK